MNANADLLDALAERLADAIAEKVTAAVVEAMPAQAVPWKLMSVDEAAAALGRSRRSVFSYIKYRGLPVVHLDSGAVRIDPRDLDDWCRERRIPAADFSETACRPLATPRSMTSGGTQTDT